MKTQIALLPSLLLLATGCFAAEKPTVFVKVPTNGTEIKSLSEIGGSVTEGDAGDLSRKVEVGIVRSAPGTLSNNMWDGQKWLKSSAAGLPLAAVLRGKEWRITGGLPAGKDLLSGNYYIKAAYSSDRSGTVRATSAFSVKMRLLPRGAGLRRVMVSLGQGGFFC